MKRIRISFGQHASFLRLFAGVDLNKKIGALPLFLSQTRHGFCQFGTVHGMNGLEQTKWPDGPCWFATGRSDADQHPIKLRAKIGPFASGLLNAVFAENAVALAPARLRPGRWAAPWTRRSASHLTGARPASCCRTSIRDLKSRSGSNGHHLRFGGVVPFASHNPSRCVHP
jgi:hypothetical protein